MSKAKPRCKIVSDGDDIFVVVDGVKIAKRGCGPQAKTWVSLEPGWRVLDSGKVGHRGYEIVVEYDSVRQQ